MRGLVPPLSGSEWLTKDSSVFAIRIAAGGVQGPMRFRGVKYDNICLPPSLSDLEIAQVVTFTATSFGNKGAVLVSEVQVKGVRESDKGRKSPWTAYELDAGLAFEGASNAAAKGSNEEKPAYPPAVAAQIERGNALYLKHCAACHQASGEGLARIFPPLKTSEWVAMGPKVLVPIILQGVEGPLVVSNQLYDSKCPPSSEWSTAAIVAGRLKRLADRTSSKKTADLATQQADIDDRSRIDAEIADLLTYVGNSWGSKMQPVTINEIKALRDSNSSRDKPWTAVELKSKK